MTGRRRHRTLSHSPRISGRGSLKLVDYLHPQCTSIRALWSLLDGIWGVFKGSGRVLVGNLFRLLLILVFRYGIPVYIYIY